jgi:hypothetical protein
MKRHFATMMMIISCILLFLAFKAATKELGSTIAEGQGSINSTKYTPFNYKPSEDDKMINDVLSRYSGNDGGMGSARNEYFDELEKEAAKYQIITFILVFSGIISLLFGLYTFLNSRKSQAVATNATIIIESGINTKKSLNYAINKGELTVEINAINKFPWVGDKVLLNGCKPPDGKYKIAFMNYLYVKNGSVIKTTFL